MHLIRLAKIEEANQILTILNTVTLHLHNKGIQQWEYPWNVEEITDEIISKHIYVLEADGKLSATFSLKGIKKLNDLPIEEDSLYLYRIAVMPEFQGKGTGEEIVKYSQSFAKKLSKELYLDCWAGNKKLREFYSKSFKYLGDFPEGDYFISVFKE